jgi:hypothetical protein
MVRRAVYRALDGHRIMLSGELDLSRPWTSVARYVIGGRLHELTSGNHRFAASWARDLGVSWDEEYRLPGGRLRVGSARGDRDGTTGLREPLLAATWYGRRHALVAHLYDARPADALRLFAALLVREYADGLAVIPTFQEDASGGGASGRRGIRRGVRRGARERGAGDRAAARPVELAEPAQVVKDVPDLGLLEISTLDDRSRRRFPPWRGARVPGGELFRDTHDEEGVFFVLTTGTAMVTILPHKAGSGRAPDLLDRLYVEVMGGGSEPRDIELGGTGRDGARGRDARSHGPGHAARSPESAPSGSTSARSAAHRSPAHRSSSPGSGTPETSGAGGRTAAGTPTSAGPASSSGPAGAPDAAGGAGARVPNPRPAAR